MPPLFYSYTRCFRPWFSLEWSESKRWSGQPRKCFPTKIPNCFLGKRWSYFHVKNKTMEFVLPCMLGWNGLCFLSVFPNGETYLQWRIGFFAEKEPCLQTMADFFPAAPGKANGPIARPPAKGSRQMPACRIGLASQDMIRQKERARLRRNIAFKRRPGSCQSRRSWCSSPAGRAHTCPRLTSPHLTCERIEYDLI